MTESKRVPEVRWSRLSLTPLGGTLAHMRGIVIVSLLVLCSMLPSRSHAQDRRWAIVAATSSPDALPRALELAEHAAAALAASGEAVVSREQATGRIETQLSEPFRPMPEELGRRIGQTAEQVLEDVAFGRNQRALDIGQPLLADLDPHLAGIGRDERAAADVANLCLFVVRAHLQKRDEGAAREQAWLCLRLVPDLAAAADPRMHPPSVVALVSTMRDDLDAGGGGVLAVHSSPTDPEECTIRVNGRAMGQSPLLRITIPPGTYSVQMECDPSRPGRLHAVTVSGGAPTRAVLHARLAQALETRPGLSLVYSDPGDVTERLSADISRLGTLLGASRVLVAVDDGSSATLRAFALHEGSVAELTGSAAVPQPIDDQTSRAAVRDVMAGRRVGESSSATRETAIATRSTISPIGPVVAGIGAAAVIAAVVTGILALDADAQASAGCADGHCPAELAGRADEARTMAYATDGLLFSGLAVATLGIVLSVLVTDADTDSTQVAGGCDTHGCSVTVGGSF